VTFFTDFVVWGHEHECKIVPTPSSEGEFYVCQPGSTIATSLSEFEAKEKYAGLRKSPKTIYLLFIIYYFQTHRTFGSSWQPISHAAY
jgi:hypothetical protein